jgi:hypothetical protein
MAAVENREHFIPIRRSELVDLLGADDRLAAADREPFRHFCRLVCATHHFEYHKRLEELKNAYAPFDPDRDTKLLLPLRAEERQQRLNELFKDFAWLMERANFRHLSTSDLEPSLGQASDWGIHMDVDFSAFDRIALFARGDTQQKRTRRRLRHLYRPEETCVPVYQRLVLILKMRKHKRLPPTVDTESVYLKIFKDIPKLDLNMLLPGARVRLTRLDKSKIGVPLVSGLGYMVWKILASLGLVLWNLADDALRVLLTAGGNPWVMWALASGAAGYGYRSYYGYRQTKQRYHLTLTESLYYQNLDSNFGVLARILDEAEEQEAREAILAYFFLWCYAGADGWTSEQLDAFAESYLEQNTGVKVDFEIDDALQKLQRMQIVHKHGDRYRVVPIARALEVLDRIWDNCFQYNNPEPQTWARA